MMGSQINSDVAAQWACLGEYEKEHATKPCIDKHVKSAVGPELLRVGASREQVGVLVPKLRGAARDVLRSLFA